FLLGDGVVEVIDYMPVGLKRGHPGFRQLVRRVEAIRGEVPLRVECCPAFNYARDPHKVELTKRGAVFRSEKLSVEMDTTVPLQVLNDCGGVEATLSLKAGEKATFVLRQLDEPHLGAPVLSEDTEQDLFNRTVEFWHRWLSKCCYTGRWREMVYRSALLLKMLTFEPTGALVASPTCSLPEAIGGPRNWDYRYTWMRDAAFSLYGLLRIGFTEEAGAFMGWLEQRCHERNPDGGLQIMYGLHGEHRLEELTLDHLDGYKHSRPVRIGNGAYSQLQLDIYGELMDSVYLYNKYGAPISWDFWVELRELIDWVCDNWRRPDEGIWETRGGPQHFVYSKLMCWVAVDRGLRLAYKRSFPADHMKWLQHRDAIYMDIMQHGWSPERKAFIQHYGSTALDASDLIMPLVFFMAPNDPRMLSTIEAISKDPSDGGLLSNSLVYRYNTKIYSDGLPGEEGTFNMCTFWLVEALTRAGKTDRAKLDQARLVFEKMLGYTNHLGLYAEQTGSHGEALGNFPQAFTHLALISAAYNLDRTLSGRNW
ncbi:MAG TPA: glycoside hydrolase family 15 protein, partial [Tepidisphaeraceae bacterium]|nr:glycoside hydrolase family 15 protein [Tepidisphaeraceae bacterium]